MTREERIKNDFRIKLEALKIRKKWSDAELAKRLGVTSVTISHMRRDPFRVSGQYILVIQDLYEEAERKCRNY